MASFWIIVSLVLLGGGLALGGIFLYSLFISDKEINSMRKLMGLAEDRKKLIYSSIHIYDKFSDEDKEFLLSEEEKTITKTMSSKVYRDIGLLILVSAVSIYCLVFLVNFPYNQIFWGPSLIYSLLFILKIVSFITYRSAITVDVLKFMFGQRQE